MLHAFWIGTISISSWVDEVIHIIQFILANLILLKCILDQLDFVLFYDPICNCSLLFVLHINITIHFYTPMFEYTLYIFTSVFKWQYLFFHATNHIIISLIILSWINWLCRIILYFSSWICRDVLLSAMTDLENWILKGMYTFNLGVFVKSGLVNTSCYKANIHRYIYIWICRDYKWISRLKIVFVRFLHAAIGKSTNSEYYENLIFINCKFIQ